MYFNREGRELMCFCLGAGEVEVESSQSLMPGSTVAAGVAEHNRNLSSFFLVF